MVPELDTVFGEAIAVHDRFLQWTAQIAPGLRRELEDHALYHVDVACMKARFYLNDGS